MSERACERCEYELGSSCYFPEPKRGGEPPFMVTAAVPDARQGGKKCIQFRPAHTPSIEQASS